jgi:uncharacterized protein YyaL (SSP411 family)
MSAWTNRLANERSPYLRQHANNPVDWHPWGEEAFATARESDRPIFLSIGYAACHWCHVMEHESFRDPQLAAYLNTHFVPVKVDREARPDVDALYIAALLQINGNAGWPASLFLLPDGRPFTGATYLPPQAAHGLPSFRQVLERVHENWRKNREAVERAAEGLVALIAHEDSETQDIRPNLDGYREAVTATLRLHDAEHGGFGGEQKFPQPALLELLLLGAHDHRTGSREALDRTLRAMDQGGLQDPLGGGFHRYCIDRAWTVPHFEKMLYDNAQLLRVYARASALWQQLGDEGTAADAQRVARDTAEYLLRDLRAGDGTFFSSEDADDPEGEGVFYTFSPAEARAVLGAGAELPFGITEEGHDPSGRSVLSTRAGRPSEDVRARLLAARNQRPRPAIDDKCVVAWNGLAIGALAEAGRLLGCSAWIEASAIAAHKLLEAMGEDGLVPRILGDTTPGTLEDHAFLADGLLDLYQAQPGVSRWLEAAATLAQAAIDHYAGENGGYYQALASSGLVVRLQDFADGAEPSGNGRLAEVLRKLRAYGALVHGEALDRLLSAAAPRMIEKPFSTPELWAVVRGESASAAPWSLIIAGETHHPRTQAFLKAWNARWRPQGIVAIVPDSTDVSRHFGAFADREPAADGGPLAYVCRFGVCEAPLADPDALRHLLDHG